MDSKDQARTLALHAQGARIDTPRPACPGTVSVRRTAGPDRGGGSGASGPQMSAAGAPAPPLFISYSRQQLYFAEALALHLQAGGQAVWFDLQQLHVGSDWADGLQSGVGDAARLLLVVSRASLASPWTRAEWQGMADKGAELVLVVFEDVVLPPALQGLPSFDFRAGFEAPLLDLLAWLEGRAPPRHDTVAPPSRLGLPRLMPAMLWATGAALLLPLVLMLIGLAAALLSGRQGVAGWMAICGVAAAWTAARHALPFWRRKLDIRRLRRALLRGLLLSLLALVSALFIWQSWTLVALLMLPWLATLWLVALGLRRSAVLLRWMAPDEALQPLRRAVHGPLLAAGETLVDDKPAGPAEQSAAADPSFSYALHAADADQPLARRIESVLAAQGHRRVAAEASPDHPLAVLSNRSSSAWIQGLTRAHPGRLICIVASTIELSEQLADTARFQWVDFRDADTRDIETLARSLVDRRGSQRRSALEVTPEAIDRWKVPGGIRLLRSATELFGAFALIWALTDLVGLVLVPLLGHTPNTPFNPPRTLLLGLTGGLFLWLSSQALVYRRVPAALMYPLLIGAVTAVALMARVFPKFLQDVAWLPLVLFLPFVLYSMLDGRHWLPAFAARGADEVGIKRSIERDFNRRNGVVVGAWVLGVVAAATAIGLLLPPPPPA